MSVISNELGMFIPFYINEMANNKWEIVGVTDNSVRFAMSVQDAKDGKYIKIQEGQMEIMGDVGDTARELLKNVDAYDDQDNIRLYMEDLGDDGTGVKEVEWLTVPKAHLDRMAELWLTLVEGEELDENGRILRVDVA